MRRLLFPALVAVLASFSLSASAAPKPHSASGTIVSYDATAHTLVLNSTSANMTFTLNDQTKVWLGSKSSGLEELLKEPGAKATVRYTVSGETKTAESVRITPASTRPAAAKHK